jgi:hypothetical protein
MQSDIIKEVRVFLKSKGFNDLNEENDLNYFMETFSDNKTRIIIKYKKE